jgi:hypothetical protein
MKKLRKISTIVNSLSPPLWGIRFQDPDGVHRMGEIWEGGKCKPEWAPHIKPIALRGLSDLENLFRRGPLWEERVATQYSRSC